MSASAWAFAASMTLFLAAAPGASAQDLLPPPLGATEHVSSSFWTDFGEHVCTSRDTTEQLETGVTSSILHSPSGSSTRYHLQLDANLARPDCPAIGLAFTSPAAWPGPGEQSYGAIASPCGATGEIGLQGGRTETFITLQVFIPSQCGAGVAEHVFATLFVQPMGVFGGEACLSHVLPFCAGIVEGHAAGTCEDSEPSGWTNGPLVRGDRRCYAGGSESNLGVPAIHVRANENHCTIEVFEPLLNTMSTSMGCPTGTGAVLRTIPWGSVLP